MDQEKDTLKGIIAGNGSTFPHIILFNTVDSNDSERGINQLILLYQNLLTINGLFCGVETVVLLASILSTQQSSESTLHMNANVVLFFSWLLSAMGAVVSFIAIEYCNGIRGESLGLIVAGVLAYWKFFYLSDLFAFMANLLFIVALMMFAQVLLPSHFGLACLLDVCLAVAAVLLMIAHRIIIQQRQVYKLAIPNNPVNVYGRKLYGISKEQ